MVYDLSQARWWAGGWGKGHMERTHVGKGSESKTLNFSQLVIQKADREKNVIIYKAKPCSKNINAICIIAKKKGGKPLGGLSSWCVIGTKAESNIVVMPVE